MGAHGGNWLQDKGMCNLIHMKILFIFIQK